MRKLIVVLGALALVAVGAVAYASIPGPDGVIHACYKNSNPAQGALIAIDSAASCPSGYTALNWNQTGPQGPAGADGVSGYERVDHHFTNTFSPGTSYSLTAECPTGKKVLGGGFEGWEGMGLIRSFPGGDAQWAVQIVPTSERNGFDVWAVCAFTS